MKDSHLDIGESIDNYFHLLLPRPDRVLLNATSNQYARTSQAIGSELRGTRISSHGFCRKSNNQKRRFELFEDKVVTTEYAFNRSSVP
jgi:hypothetical protein